MTTFKFKKAMENIEEPELLDEGWYKVRITEDPKLLPNNKAKELLGDEATFEQVEMANADDQTIGMNMVCKVEVVSAFPDENGRKLTIYIPYPMDADDKRYDNRGMIVADAKQERIAKLATAIHGEVLGDELDINQGNEFQAFVDQGLNKKTKLPSNSIDLFAGFKPVSQEDSFLSSGSELDIPLKKKKGKKQNDEDSAF